MIIRPKFPDKRGYITPLYRDGDYDVNFVEDRVTLSTNNVIRGFHGDDRTVKLMTCIYGELRLIVWDIHRHEKIFDEIMSADNCKSVLVYPNTLNAHQCLTNECLLHYKLSSPYDLSSQFSVHYNDTLIDPKWSVVDESKI